MNEQLSMLLNNIKATIDEISQLQSGAESTVTEDDRMPMDNTGLDTKKPVMMDEMSDYEESDKDKKEDEKGMKEEESMKSLIKKVLTETPSDGADANDPAEERVEDPIPEVSEENIDEVAKALAKILTKKKSVVKSVNNNDSKILKSIAGALGQIAMTQKNLAVRQQESEIAFEKLAQGLGIADEVEKSFQTKKVEKAQRGLNSSEDVIKAFSYMFDNMKNVNKSEVEDKEELSHSQKVRKSLTNADFLKKLYGGK